MALFKLNIYKNQQRKGVNSANKQGAQQQRPESHAITPPGMQVNAEYVNSTKGSI